MIKTIPQRVSQRAGGFDQIMECYYSECDVNLSSRGRWNSCMLVLFRVVKIGIDLLNIQAGTSLGDIGEVAVTDDLCLRI